MFASGAINPSRLKTTSCLDRGGSRTDGKDLAGYLLLMGTIKACTNLSSASVV